MKVDKKRQLSLFIVFVVFCISIMSSSISAQLVTNGGFEASDTGSVASGGINGWLVLAIDGLDPAPEFEIVSDSVHSGDRALKVTVHGLGTNQWDIQIVADSIPVTPQATYDYSVWAKAEKPGAQVNFTVGSYTQGEYAAIRPANLTTSWKKYTVSFKVTNDETIVRGPIHFNYASASDNTIYIDDLIIVDQNFGKTPVTVEAESGIIGSDFAVQESGDITYVTATESFSGSASPEDSIRTITYQVEFQDSGSYNLFARIRVGAETFDNDSFFAGKGFGSKDDTSASDWVFVNGLASGGFSGESDVVSGLGTVGSETWKWVNITQNYFPTDSSTTTADYFVVEPDSLTKTFKIGSREDGLFIDKLAFGKSYLYYTVDDLDKGLPGSITFEKPDSSAFWQGPPFAEGDEKFLGNVKGINDNVFANYWNQLTPGNEGKWGSIATTMDTTKWNWSGLDALYNYAKSHDLIFKDHCLIWGAQQPSWISSLDSTQQAQYIETWIRMVGQKYPDLDMVDVVNEPLATHNPPDGKDGRANYKDALGGDGVTGWDWVIKSFELARKYLPNAKLLLNDYGIINDNNATNQYLQIINILKTRELIDGIGVQGHRFEFESKDVNVLKSNLSKLGATGLPVYISEFDLGNFGDSGTPNDANQLNLYKKIFPVIWEHPAVRGITLWGYLEGQMWQTTCYLVNSDGTMRPALEWLVQYIAEHPTGTEGTASDELPTDFKLEQNYPNPFNPSTNIKFSINEPGNVSLKIYDILGREVTTLVKDNFNAGVYNVTWDAKNSGGAKVGSGTYFYRIVSGNNVITKKMLLLK